MGGDGQSPGRKHGLTQGWGLRCRVAWGQFTWAGEEITAGLEEEIGCRRNRSTPLFINHNL